jgi:hypothetical protein
MSSLANPQPELPTADDLVAYLDGELAPDDCRRVEQRLATDADYRQQLRDLDQAWEALDSLPSAKATEDLTRTTLELVTVAAEGDASKVKTTAASAQRTRRLWQITVGAAAIALSFILAKAIIPDPNRHLLNDLPAIVYADSLQLVPSVDFLRQLESEIPLESLMIDDAAGQKVATQFPLISSDLTEVRRQWVESQSAEQKSKLAAQASRFEARRADQDRLRALVGEIRDASDSQRLQKTLVAYSQWLAGLTAGRQEQLREDMADLSTTQQVELVRDFVQRENAQASRQLSDEDVERLRHEALEIAQQRQGAVMREMRRRGDADRIRQLDVPQIALMILAREIWNDRGDDTRERLEDSLSANAQAHLESLDRRSRRRQLWQWVRESMQSKAGPDDLERFFAEKLNNDERERLLSMPADEMQSQLERLYYVTQFGLGETAPWWNAFGEDREQQARPLGPQPDRRPDGPPRDRPPGPPPREGFDGNRVRPGTDGPPGPGQLPELRGEEFPNERRPPADRRRPPRQQEI